MPEVILNGPAGRLEGRYHQSKRRDAPLAIVLHPHPQFGGTMNNQVIYNLFYTFVRRGFSVLRYNSRGVGRSEGFFDHGTGELSDVACVLDWMQAQNPESKNVWIAGFSFGSWVGMQLMMRRPEIAGFISVSAPTNIYDYTFLAPCPSSGIFIHGDEDQLVPFDEIEGLMDKIKLQKGVEIERKVVSGANHLFDHRLEGLLEEVNQYLDKRLNNHFDLLG